MIRLLAGQNDEPLAQYILPIRFANRRFAPSLVGTILTLVGVTIFVQLGLWQLDRADQKAALRATFERGQQRTLTLTAENSESAPRYQQVRASGRFDSDRQILLDNMPSAQGRPGYRVLTPFVLDDGLMLLVDRGWIPMGDRRSTLPSLEVGEEMRTVSGKLDELPRPGLRLAEGQEQGGARWPRVLNFPEHEQLEAALGLKLASRILRLDASQPDAFGRTWNAKAGFGSERHVGYAVQWFAFALCAIVIYFLIGFRRESPN